MFIICRIDGEASPEAEQVQLNGEKEAETREGKTLLLGNFSKCLLNGWAVEGWNGVPDF